MTGARLRYHPSFEDAATLNDRYWRAVHYLGAVANRLAFVEFITPHRPAPTPPSYLDQALPERGAAFAAKARFVNEPAEEVDTLVVWRAANHIRGGHEAVTLDPEALHEGDIAIEFGASLRPHSAEERAAAQARLTEAIEAARAPVAHVFGTGPSLAQAPHRGIAGAAIICNSAIKDDALIEATRPAFVVAVDPIFHAGASRHAGAFRERLIDVLSRTRAHFIVQERDAHLYEATLPARLHDRLIPIPVRYATAPNLDLPGRFELVATRNVLTLVMLPLAAALGREIRIYGCDGRPAHETNRFWSYAPKAEFSEELALQREAHPGFFTLDYQDYYALHCETVRVWMRAMERCGLRVVAATPSYIPALAARRAPGVALLHPQAPATFRIQARGAWLFRSAQSYYGAFLGSAAAPWLKQSLRGIVRAVRSRQR